MVVHADLPAIAAEDIEAAMSQLGSRGWIQRAGTAQSRREPEKNTAVSQPSGVNDPLQKLSRSWLAGIAEHLGRRTLFQDHPSIQEQHVVRDIAGEPHFMSCDQHRHPVALQSTDDVQNFRNEFGVE